MNNKQNYLNQNPSPLTKKHHGGEVIIQTIFFLCAAISVFTTLGIAYELVKESMLFFRTPGVSIFEFLTTTTWQPTIGQYGVLPLLTATLITSFFALLIAIPLGLGAAIFLSEYSHPTTRKIIKPLLEILAGVPTVVYGYFALTVMTPLLRSLLGTENIQIYNMLSAGLVMGIMILPLFSSMSEDALNAVPNSLREAAFAMGSTKFETSLMIVVPSALSGIIAAFIVSVSRAIGETMIVAIASGSGSAFTFNPLKAAETMTGYIARISGGDISYDTPDYNSIFAIGLLLFIFTFTLNLISRRFSKKYREVYE